MEVEYYTLTVEECLVLQEMRQCSSDSDDTSHRFEEITDRDVVMGSASDSEDDDTAMADDWSESSDDADEFYDWLSDEMGCSDRGRVTNTYRPAGASRADEGVLEGT